MQRAARALVSVAGLSLITFLVVFLLLEACLRAIFGVDGIHPGSALFWQLNHANTKIELIEPPLFVTDAHGIQVAFPVTPGTNAEGYRTPDFDEPADGRPTVLFLGDSFTWGDTARPYRLSFVDRVRDAGYKTINLGVPATGVTQYAAQAQLYVPQLRPDAVCVMFYTENDFEAEAPVRPGLSRTFVTNLGLLYAATPDGRQLTLDEAVARRNGHVPPWLTPGVAGVISRSALLRLAASVGSGDIPRELDLPRGLESMRAIRAACERAGIPLFVFLIPTRESRRNALNTVEAVSGALAEFSPVMPPEFTASEYRPEPDLHFNNEGHAKMALQVVETLKAAKLNPKPGAGPDDLDLYLVSERPTLDVFCAALGVSGKLREEVERHMRLLPFILAGNLVRAAPGATSALHFLADARAKDPAVTPASPEFESYCDLHGPGDGLTYREIIDGLSLKHFQVLGAMLDEAQQRRLKRIPLDRFIGVRAGDDPILAKALSLRDPDATMTWADFELALGLDERASRQLQQEILSLRRRPANTANVDAVLGILSPDQRAAFMGLPLGGLEDIVLDAVPEAAASEPRGPHWAIFKAQFNLRPEQADTALAALRALKEAAVEALKELPGGGGAAALDCLRAAPQPPAWDAWNRCIGQHPEAAAKIQAAEAEARAKIAALLDEKQQRRWRMAGEVPLLPIEIPEDPFAAALAQ